MMLLVAMTQRPFCGEHYRYDAVRATAYRDHDCGSELAHIRQPPEHDLIGSIAPSRERSALEKMPGSLSVCVIARHAAAVLPSAGNDDHWPAAI